MPEKGDKLWWWCSRWGLMVYNEMCDMACLPEEVSECTDKKEKPQSAYAPINPNLDRRLKKMLERKKEKRQ